MYRRSITFLHNYKSSHLLAIKAVLRIENTEHSLIQLREEFLQGVLQIHISILVVGLEVFEEVGKHVRISLVENSVGLLEHKVEIPLGMSQELGEEV